jgi:hypothetical protein
LCAVAQAVDVGMQNALNGFNMLSNKQFIENVRLPLCSPL